MTAWVVGAKGMLGQEVVSALEREGIAHVGSDAECDITDRSALRTFAGRHHVEWIVNCSAYTAVDRAEAEEELAFRVNALGAENLAMVASEIGAKIIHVSTDYVFNGEASSPYTEEAVPDPSSAYGRTKAAGEKLLRAAADRSFIVRTAWLYGPGGKNFVYTMLRLMNERDKVSVVNDQRGTPTYAPNLADALVSFITAGSSEFGIYHYTNAGETTWFEFAKRIYELGRTRGHITNEPAVEGIPTSEYPTAAKRPGYSVLATEKIARTLGLAIPSWEDGLDRFFRAIEKQREGETA